MNISLHMQFFTTELNVPSLPIYHSHTCTSSLFYVSVFWILLSLPLKLFIIFFCCIIAFLLYIVELRRRKGRKEGKYTFHIINFQTVFSPYFFQSKMFYFPGSMYSLLYEVRGKIAALALCVAVALEVKDKRNKTFLKKKIRSEKCIWFLFVYCCTTSVIAWVESDWQRGSGPSDSNAFALFISLTYKKNVLAYMMSTIQAEVKSLIFGV